VHPDKPFAPGDCAGQVLLAQMTFAEEDATVLMMLAGAMYLQASELDPILEALQCCDYDQVADFLEGTGRTGKAIPHEKRWWQSTARHLNNKRFKSAFRCR